MAKRYPDSRPYPYNTDKSQWTVFWIVIVLIVLAVILSWAM
ncbi:hypothetical protein ACFFIY_00595 [Bhargavaea ullalensis]|uniref:Uncharacterized protein n=1 Tax=Bhargavaea ullalensis TaxID=1265685 RepID=A0ABV2GDH5_9BACL